MQETHRLGLGSRQPWIEAPDKETGYRILSHRLDFFGLCPECQAKE
jgi:Fe2+ or Zn2+ uptake regulation protein